jgi:hypothetical protein
MAARKKKLTARRGDVVAIRLADGTYGLGQVAEWTRHSMRLIVYTGRTSAPVPIADLGRPIASLDLTNELVEDGVWPVVEHRECRFDAPTRPEGVSKGGHAAGYLLDVFHGLGVLVGAESIDFHYEPMLLPSVDPRELEEGLARAVAAGRGPRGALMQMPQASPSDEVASSGPAELRISIRFAGGGMPASADLRLRHELERRLKEFGTVSDAGAGEGRLDVWVQVPHGHQAVTRAELILRELGILDRAEIEARSVPV